MALPAVAQGLLPRRPPAARRARVRVEPAELDRAQRLVLRPPTADVVPALVRRDARRLRLLGQRPAVRHAHEAAGRRGCADGQLLRLRSTCARQQTRTGAVATTAEL